MNRDDLIKFIVEMLNESDDKFIMRIYRAVYQHHFRARR